MSKDKFGFIIPMNVSLNRQLKAINLVNILLRLGFVVFWAKNQFNAKTEVFPKGYVYSPGDFIVPLRQEKPYKFTGTKTFTRTLINEISQDLDVILHSLYERIQIDVYQLSNPRIAIYSGPGTYSCYLWYQQCLEKLGFMAECLSTSEIKEGKLMDYDLYVQPGGDETWQSEALWPEGREEIRKFLKVGGNYLGSCGGFDIAGYADGSPLGSPNSGKVKHLNLIKYNPTRNLPRSEFPHDQWAKLRYFHMDFGEYSQLVPVKSGTYIPVRIKETDSPIVFGYKDLILPGLYYAGGPLAKELGPNAISIADFAPDLLPIDSPWTMPPDYAINLLEGASAIIFATFGKGKLVLFSPHPEAPNCEEHFKLVANSVYFLTGKGPFNLARHPHKGNFILRCKKFNAGKLQTVRYKVDDDAYKLLELINEFNKFKSLWFEIAKKLEGWTYEFIPEFILKLPGYSQIDMPELEIKVPDEKLHELLQLIRDLNANYHRLCEVESRFSKISGKKITAIMNLISNSKSQILGAIESILAAIHPLKNLIVEARQQLEYMKIEADAIVKTRNEIARHRQPPGIERRLTRLWKKLDQQQYEFNLKIWADILLKIDGKAEVPIFSEWKEGIIEKRSKGITPKLINLKFASEWAIENSRYVLTIANYFFTKK